MENKKTIGTPEETPFCPKNRWKIDTKKCTLCGECVDACSRALLSIEHDMVMIEPEGNCNQCGDCAAACAYKAIVLT